MAQIKIKRLRRFDYDDEYSLEVNTTKILSKEDYGKIIDAIKVVEGVFDTHLDVLFAEKKKQEAVK